MAQLFESFLKTAVAFFGILVYTRILGKQQISQMTFYEYVTGITFGSIAAAIALDREANTGIFLWVLTVFVALNYFTGVLTVKSRPMRKLIEGEPTILIHNGKILEHNMAKLRYDMENLMMQLREKNVFNIADVEFAVAENDGNLSVLVKSQKRPVTPADLNMPTRYEGIPSEIIVDGEVVYQNLKQNNLDEQWLIQELKKRGYNSPKDILYASLDTDGNLYIDERRDKMPHMTDVSD
ncbi:MAG: DUF421 domain-containing protein [Syntrophothermus sp.]|uniref:YetF domain-containing protein n=1 Tax=Syntrophothermus sp. TaxID=2736299 RepID=UPI00257F6DBD|nr:DUF421 domain-containing protein [Syntrophothermus sp.]NSW83239.1 DUF421 domain-containing protein [Syntrophothermus sp.]